MATIKNPTAPKAPKLAPVAAPTAPEPVKVEVVESKPEGADKPKAKRGGPRLGQQFYVDFITKYQTCNSMEEAVTKLGLSEKRIRDLVAMLRSDQYKTNEEDGSRVKVREGLKMLKIFGGRRGGGPKPTIDWAALAAAAEAAKNS